MRNKALSTCGAQLPDYDTSVINEGESVTCQLPKHLCEGTHLGQRESGTWLEWTHELDSPCECEHDCDCFESNVLTEEQTHKILGPILDVWSHKYST